MIGMPLGRNWKFYVMLSVHGESRCPTCRLLIFLAIQVWKVACIKEARLSCSALENNSPCYCRVYTHEAFRDSRAVRVQSLAVFP